MTFRVFFTGGDGETCGAEEIDELHVVECDEEATWDLVDDVTRESTPVCADHKDAAKAAGITV